jgi:transposase
MVRMPSDTARLTAASWECPRCGRSNRDRDHACPNCRLARRAAPGEPGEPAFETAARPEFRRLGLQAESRTGLTPWRDPVLG